MSDIKQVIRLLCKHLNFLFDADVKPDYFRLAKFNKTDENVINVFWNLLNKLTINSNDGDNSNQNIKNYLKNMEYTNNDFYKLSEDASSQNVRELLITLCFLVCKNLDKVVIGEIENSPFHPDFKLIQDHSPKPSILIVKENTMKFKNKDDRTQYLEWIENRVDLNKRIAREYEEQNKKLLMRLNRDVAIKSLSINETLALNSEKYCRIFLEKSSRVLQILENHKLWIAKEALFWQWMETVLLEKKKDAL